MSGSDPDMSARGMSMRTKFTLDVVVGSEFGDREPIVGRGSFSGVVSEPPAGY
jgi:hypothetical protein